MIKIENGERVCYSDLSGERIGVYKGYGRPKKFTDAERAKIEKERRKARAKARKQPVQSASARFV